VEYRQRQRQCHFYNNCGKGKILPFKKSGMIRKELVEVEAFLLALEAISFLVSMSKRDLHWFLSFALFGFGMEFVGVVLAGTHVHEEFTWQLTSFLPLKECLWYSLTFYAALSTSRRLTELMPTRNLTDLVSIALVMTVAQQMHNIPYDLFGGRPPMLYWKMLPEFEMCNMSKEALGCVFYSWLAMGTTVGIVFASSKKFDWSKVKILLLVVSSVGLNAVFWTPYHVVKSLSCYILNGDMYFLHITEPGIFWQGHKHCIRTSPVSDMRIWAAFAVLVVTFIIANCKMKFVAGSSVNPMLPVIWSFFAFHWIQAYKHDRDILPYMLVCSFLGGMFHFTGEFVRLVPRHGAEKNE